MNVRDIFEKAYTFVATRQNFPEEFKNEVRENINEIRGKVETIPFSSIEPFTELDIFQTDFRELKEIGLFDIIYIHALNNVILKAKEE